MGAMVAGNALHRGSRTRLRVADKRFTCLPCEKQAKNGDCLELGEGVSMLELVATHCAGTPRADLAWRLCPYG
jgi:hypothetical protein